MRRESTAVMQTRHARGKRPELVVEDVSISLLFLLVE